MRVERMKNMRSSFNGTLKRENAYAAVTPSTTESAVEPNAMMREFTKRGLKLEGPTSTMLLERASVSHVPEDGGSWAMYSGVCRERVKKRLQYPSADGVNSTLGGYAIESGPDLSPVAKIQASGTIVITAYNITRTPATRLARAEGSTTECACVIPSVGMGRP